MIRSQNLRDKVSVEAVTETRDSFGGVSRTWAHSFYEWAEVRQMTGIQYMEAKALQSTITHEVKFYSNSSTTLLLTAPATYRIVFDSNRYLYPIYSTRPNTRDMITVSCNEGIEK
jgi:SPP1 family predicted phage head-tail adaptor